MQSLARRLEKGGVLSCAGISAAAQPFLAALLQHLFPRRPIVVVTEGLRTQESAQQDLATWLALGGEVQRLESKVQSQAMGGGSQESESSITHHASRITHHASSPPQPLFYPSWEVLPHEVRLPHADVISERLETLVALTHHASRLTPQAPLVVTSVVALLQRTYPAGTVRQRTRTLTRGDRADPLDLVEWLEEQGYEPEAQVTQKGEIALRGGILDIYPLTSPWPVRMEFFGDELESLRQFDPLTQMSREEITAVTIPPAGELGLLKQMRNAECPSSVAALQRVDGVRSENPQPALGTLLDYLPSETVFLLCEPELLAKRADEYARQVPDGDPFFILWETFQAQAREHGMTCLEASEAEPVLGALEEGQGEGEASVDSPATIELPGSPGIPHSVHPPQCCYGGRALRTPHFESLEAFRPLPERAPEPQVAEAQRREFFAQLHRWLRQGYGVHVFCNNNGERQRFTEIWGEYGFAEGDQTGVRPSSGAAKHVVGF